MNLNLYKREVKPLSGVVCPQFQLTRFLEQISDKFQYTSHPVDIWFEIVKEERRSIKNEVSKFNLIEELIYY